MVNKMTLIIAQIQSIANNINRLLGKVKITDGTQDLAVNADGSLNVNNTVVAAVTYKAGQDISVTTVEQEKDLGAVFTSLTIANTGTADMLIRLNSNSNDEILLNRRGSDDSAMSLDIQASKFYFRTVSGTSTLRYIATR